MENYCAFSKNHKCIKWNWSEMLASLLFIMGNFLILHKPPDYKALTVFHV